MQFQRIDIKFCQLETQSTFKAKKKKKRIKGTQTLTVRGTTD